MLYDEETGQVNVVDFGLSQDIAPLDEQERREAKESDYRSLRTLKQTYLYPKYAKGAQAVSSSVESSIGEDLDLMGTDDMFEFDESFKDFQIQDSPGKNLKKVKSCFDLSGLIEEEPSTPWSGPLIKSFIPSE